MIINIIGTDTEIGKTYISCQILQHLKNKKLNVRALKPIASGIQNINGLTINEDAYRLQQASSSNLPIDLVNPICFKDPIAPHIASEIEKCQLNVKNIIEITKTSIISQYDYMIIEGVGGLMTPLNRNETYLDLLEKWQYPIILVIGMKLGCLNHALLSYNILMHKKLKILGFIINQIDPQMLYQEENIDYLKQKLPIPFLGYCKYNSTLEIEQSFLEIFRC